MAKTRESLCVCGFFSVSGVGGARRGGLAATKGSLESDRTTVKVYPVNSEQERKSIARPEDCLPSSIFSATAVGQNQQRVTSDRTVKLGHNFFFTS